MVLGGEPKTEMLSMNRRKAEFVSRDKGLPYSIIDIHGWYSFEREQFVERFLAHDSTRM